MVLEVSALMCFDTLKRNMGTQICLFSTYIVLGRTVCICSIYRYIGQYVQGGSIGRTVCIGSINSYTEDSMYREDI